MKILLQKVSEASVSVEKSVIGSIETGYLLFVGLMEGDTKEQIEYLCDKVVNLRLFDGEDGRINDRSIQDIDGGVLVVSQFTLAASTKKGNRPDYTAAMHPQQAKEMYEYCVSYLREHLSRVETGEFGAKMEVQLVNDGPVTLLLEK